MHRLLLALACLGSGCFESNAVVKDTPDANELPPPADAETIDSDPGLPAGLTLVTPGNYLLFASKVVGGRIYAVEYSGPQITAQPTQIVSIATDTGAVETFQALGADMTNPRSLQATDQELYWLARTDDGTALFRRGLNPIQTIVPSPIFGPTSPTFPAGYTLEAFLVYPSKSLAYVMLASGTNYQLGTIPIAGQPGPLAYTMLASGTSNVVASVAFDSLTSSIAVLGTQVYVGGSASGYGFVLRFDTNAKTVSVLDVQNNTRMRSFMASAARVYWITESGSTSTLNIANPINQTGTGPVATVPTSTYGLALHDSTFYVTSLPGEATSLSITTPAAAPANPPAGTTSEVLSVATCVGMPSQDCIAKVSLLATDDTSIYFSATTGVYKYTRP